MAVGLVKWVGWTMISNNQKKNSKTLWPGNSAIVTFLGMVFFDGFLGDPNSKVVGDLQLGDKKVTLNHLGEIQLTIMFFLGGWLVFGGISPKWADLPRALTSYKPLYYISRVITLVPHVFLAIYRS